MIDIGANLTDRSFAEDLGQVLDRASGAGVEKILVTGTSMGTSSAALNLANGDERLYSTAGVHPHDARNTTDHWLDQLREIATASKVLAIGETGLDFNRNYSPPEVQRTVFSEQIRLAAECGLPLFVHDRDSEGETFELLERHGANVPGVVIHCFTGTESELNAYLNAGFYIGITGWVCDERRGLPLRQMVGAVPDDRLLIETDAPYLLPRTIRPKPRSRRNEPAFLSWVADELAGLRDTAVAELRAMTTANAQRLFGIG